MVNLVLHDYSVRRSTIRPIRTVDIGPDDTVIKPISPQAFSHNERLLDKAIVCLNNAKQCKKWRRQKYWIHAGLKLTAKRKYSNG